MLIALISMAVSAPLVPPALPPLCAPEFQTQVLAVEQALNKGQFARAATLAKALPKLKFDLAWDESKVPNLYLAAYRKSRDEALSVYRTEFGAAIKVRPASKVPADLLISFQPQLADDPETSSPASVVVFDSPTRPRIEAVIGLQMGKPLVPATPMDVLGGVSFAIGSYFGVARNVTPGSSMTPWIGGSNSPRGITPVERIAIKQNLRVVDFLLKAIKDKKRVVAEKSDMFVDPQEFQGEAIQGEVVDVSLQITNRGGGPLSYRVDGDCGCVVPDPPGQVSPHSTQLVRVTLDTKEFSAGLKRRLRIYTNDPNRPAVIVPVNLNVVPRYRFLSEGGSAKNLDQSNSFDVFLALPNGTEDLGIRAVRLTGVDAKVTYEKWEGSLPDPERNEPAMPRKGYKFRVQVTGELPPGRSLVGLDVATNSYEFPTITYPMSLQRGVVAMPEELYLGELSKFPKKAVVVLTRPGSPLKVKSVSTDAKSLTVKAVPGRKEGEIRLEVSYDGSASAGDMFATITVLLDDPRQPKIMIPVTATVR